MPVSCRYTTVTSGTCSAFRAISSPAAAASSCSVRSACFRLSVGSGRAWCQLHCGHIAVTSGRAWRQSHCRYTTVTSGRAWRRSASAAATLTLEVFATAAAATPTKATPAAAAAAVAAAAAATAAAVAAAPGAAVPYLRKAPHSGPMTMQPFQCSSYVVAVTVQPLHCTCGEHPALVPVEAQKEVIHLLVVRPRYGLTHTLAELHLAHLT